MNYSKNFFNNIFDIRNLTYFNFPKNIDIFTYSFPCQDLSVQGLQKGIDKELKTRSGLLWEIERLFIDINEKFQDIEKPKYLLMENVKNLLADRNIKNYQTWINQLDALGYASKSYVLDSSNFGSPQKRERLFLLSIRKDLQNKINFKFPNLENIKLKNKTIIKDILDLNESNFIDLSKFKTTNYTKTKTGIIKKSLINYTKFNSENYIYDIEGIGPTLTASGAQSRIKIEINNKYRYISPLESYRYMGFKDEDFWNVKKTNLLSDSKIIFTAGNSIVINVLEEIFKTLEFENE